MVTQGMHEDTS